MSSTLERDDCTLADVSGLKVYLSLKPWHNVLLSFVQLCWCRCHDLMFFLVWMKMEEIEGCGLNQTRAKWLKSPSFKLVGGGCRISFSCTLWFQIAEWVGETALKNKMCALFLRSLGCEKGVPSFWHCKIFSWVKACVSAVSQGMVNQTKDSKLT